MGQQDSFFPNLLSDFSHDKDWTKLADREDPFAMLMMMITVHFSRSWPARATARYRFFAFASVHEHVCA
ncbi:1-deoxy-D-xylulose 5-phosphate reductoisomerase [Trichinella spiralis]|uniref:1-deoxy-D-xylulose 5-phosphate reductoisomerase n=1 Tax=Trichinella spiralis TaxID=6334 RepID=A0ABR3KN81_TRISP